MGKQSAPPPPDYGPIAAASQEQTRLADQEFQQQSAFQDKQLGYQKDALDWAKAEYGKYDDLNNQIVQQQLATGKASSDAAARAQQRYESVYQPLEDQAVHTAMNYDTPQQEQLAAGAASASVAQQFAQQRTAAQQNLESFGVDPSSTRYAAMDVGLRTSQAAAQAAAANSAIQQTQATARGLQANAINVGRGLPSDINAGNNTALSAGNSAANIGLATVNTGANTMGTSTQYGGLGAQYGGNAIGALNAGTGAIGAWGNTLNAGYNNQLGAFNANQNASSGIGSLLGTAVGMIPGLAEGGSVPSAVPIGDGATPGGRVSPALSPSGGRNTDDIPAQLTAGEFVLPRDVVQWKGEEFMQKLIQKAREDKSQNARAQPRAVPSGNPAMFHSQPVHQTALPMR